MRMTVLMLAAAFALSGAGRVLASPNDLVIDQASALSEATREELSQDLAEIASDTGVESRLVVVRDLDGEREVLSATDSGQLAGATASKSALAVRGDTVFLIRRDGQDYATVTP